LKEKSLSFCQGNGNLECNNRKHIRKHVDRSRIKDNVTFIRQDIESAYNHLFEKSLENYNSKQKRSDRKIKKTYYEHLFDCAPSDYVKISGDKRKSFYEDIVQIGCMEDSGFGTEDFELTAECLKEYMNGFQERNPNFYVFNAVLHLDESTPHLHIDYIPFGHFTRGPEVQNSISQALREMGYGQGIHTLSRWRESEIEALTEICISHGIQPAEQKKNSRDSMSVDEYKEYRKIRKNRIEETEKLKSIMTEVMNILLETQKKTGDNFLFQEEISEYRSRVAELEKEITELRT